MKAIRYSYSTAIILILNMTKLIQTFIYVFNHT